MLGNRIITIKKGSPKGLPFFFMRIELRVQVPLPSYMGGYSGVNLTPMEDSSKDSVSCGGGTPTINTVIGATLSPTSNRCRR